MNKSITLIALSLMIALSAQSQITWNCGSFSCTVSDTNVTCSTNSTCQLNCTLTNFDCCSSINITQIIGSFNLPAGWFVTMCNPNGCFPITTTANNFIVPPSSTVTAKFEIHAGSNPGSGTVSARFEDVAYPSTNARTFTILANQSTTGIADNNQSLVPLLQNYPNPFSISTTIKYNLEKPDGKLVITDVLGKTIIEYKLNNISGEIMVTEYLKPGTYFYSLYSYDKMISRNKMIAQ